MPLLRSWKRLAARAINIPPLRGFINLLLAEPESLNYVSSKIFVPPPRTGLCLRPYRRRLHEQQGRSRAHRVGDHGARGSGVADAVRVNLDCCRWRHDARLAEPGARAPRLRRRADDLGADADYLRGRHS